MLLAAAMHQLECVWGILLLKFPTTFLYAFHWTVVLFPCSTDIEDKSQTKMGIPLCISFDYFSSFSSFLWMKWRKRHIFYFLFIALLVRLIFLFPTNSLSLLSLWCIVFFGLLSIFFFSQRENCTRCNEVPNAT